MFSVFRAPALCHNALSHVPLRLSYRLSWMLALVVLVLPAAAKKEKKSMIQVLPGYPVVMKFFMFWWCVFVFVVMIIFILDHLCTKWRGPARISWSKKFVFDGRASREAYWAQFADPTAWSSTHPILASADVRMMEVTSSDSDAPSNGASEALAAKDANKPVDNAHDRDVEKKEPTARLRPISFKPFAKGLGLILRHKAGSGPREGLFFCARECTSLETPEGVPWVVHMKTIEEGAGHAFLPGTEEVEVLLHPAADDGTVTCEMTGKAAVNSRISRWWGQLEQLSAEGAELMMQAINDELGQPNNEK